MICHIDIGAMGTRRPWEGAEELAFYVGQSGNDSDKVISGQTAEGNKVECSWTSMDTQIPETIINDPTGSLNSEQQAYLCFRGWGKSEEGELWESIKDTLSAYTECIHRFNWVDHKMGLCAYVSLTRF